MPHMGSAYDAFAWFYDRYWATPIQQWQRPALDQLLLRALPPGAHIVDLCCGTGELASNLISLGYKVTGVDASREMLEAARRKAPAATLLHQDAAEFSPLEPAEAVVCFFDSLNHLLDGAKLQQTFHHVFKALGPAGTFLFDVNTRAAYGELWNSSACHVEPDHAFFLRGSFDPTASTGTTRITMFRLNGTWQRNDVEVLQRPLEVAELEPMLRAAGFTTVQSFRPMEDLGMQGHFGTGRVYIRACKS